MFPMIVVIGGHTKMLRKLSEKLRGEFSLTRLVSFMVRISHENYFIIFMYNFDLLLYVFCIIYLYPVNPNVLMC